MRTIVGVGATLAIAGITASSLPQIPLSNEPLRQQQQQQPPLSSSYGSDTISFANENFERFVEGRMAKWHVPGLAMAIVEREKTWSKGFGYSNLETLEAVTPSTLFHCGSMTKSFTAAAMSLLVDDDSPEFASVQWNSPISSLLVDDFVLSDSWSSEHITITDVLSHRTGYPRHDFSGPYFNSSLDLVHAFRHLPMSEEPRVKWQYNNMMYGAMGYLIERLTNTTLADFFRDKLWHPMGMHDTYLHPGDAARSKSTLSEAYYWNNDTQSHGQVPWKDEMSIAGAGLSVSSVLDWSRYLRHMINETGPMSKAGHKAVKAAYIIADDEDLYVGPTHYGFGWNSAVFQNELIWWHSGFVNTMISYMVFIPSRQFGFVVMLNSEGHAALLAVVARVLYDFSQASQDDRIDVEAGWVRAVRDEELRLSNCSARLWPSAPSSKGPYAMELDRYVGTYHNSGYGNISVSLLCDNWVTPAGSPASPSLSPSGCMLIIRMRDVFGKRISLQLEHKSGDFWIAWFFNDDYATIRRPRYCFPLQFTFDGGGRPTLLGIDVRFEEIDQPITWFDRID